MRLFIYFSLFVSLLASCVKDKYKHTDYDGNNYGSVSVGNQVWADKNLRVKHYNNGDVIPQVNDQNVWDTLTTGAWCYYSFNSDNEEKFGILYNWYAVTDSRGIAPNGWRIPSDIDFSILVDYNGGPDLASEKLKSTTDWEAFGSESNGTNSSRFNAKPAGGRGFQNSWLQRGSNACFWASNLSQLNQAYCMEINWGTTVQVLDKFPQEGYSVRCIKQ